MQGCLGGFETLGLSIGFIQRNLSIRLKLKSTRECLHDIRLQRFGHVERTEESAWSSKFRTLRISGTLREKWPYSDFLWSAFSYIRTEYGEIRRNSFCKAF